jgi:outer membrane phospholipase A
VLEAPDLGANRVVLDIRPPPPAAPETAERPPKSGFARFIQEGLVPKEDYTPMDFFKQHIFGYEPFYFLGGYKAPEAKFQISLRYQLLNRDGPLAQKAPFLKGLNIAYTQTSLWDLGQESSPFLDTSYKPEMLYLWERADRGRWADWIRLDLQGGLQHESNGNPEIESRLLDMGDRVSYYVEDGSGGRRIKTSRSLNILYLRPTVVFGKTNGLQLALSPRVWAYVGDLDDNPDLPNYRGYADLRMTLGWAKGLQLSTTGRLGDDGNRGSVQVDLSYPLMNLFSGSFSVYLYAQYFTGYGESLLLYNRRSEALRFGFAIYR